MADIKVRDLTDTSSVTLDNQIMVLTNDAQNQVQNITVENLLTNVLSSDNGNVLEQGTDGKLYVETPENITGDLADLSTINKTSLVNAINEVDSDITDEATTRANADNNLQSQIDAITAASDVTDIVGTYAQLQAYDTTGLPDNSIIKVLQDESRQDETTYYRWVITGGVGAWVLIGEEGPYYTKSQADSLFATQQTTGNLASLDTSDKTSLVNAINELSSVLDPTQTADYINNSKAVESGSVSSNSIILSDVIRYAHSTFDLSKFTVVGSPVITSDGIVTSAGRLNHFNLSDYDYTKPFQIKFRWSRNTARCFLYAFNGVDTSLRTTTPDGNNKYAIQFYLNNSAILQETGHIIFDINTTYDILFNWTGSVYSLYYKLPQDKQYTLVSSATNSTAITTNNNATLLGVTGQYQDFTGEFDLKQFSITVDGVEVFSGNKTGIDTIKPDDYTVVGSPTISADGIASGLDSSNYIALNNITLGNEWELTYKIIWNTATRSNSSIILQMKDGTVTFQILNQTSKAITSSIYGMFDSAKYISYIADGEVSQFTDGDIVIINLKVNNNTLYYTVFKNGTVFKNNSISSITNNFGTLTDFAIGEYNNSATTMPIDLNSFKIYVDGNLVYQPCLKIPYTKGSEQYGGKYVNAQYLDRVKDAYEQGLANDYFTLDEVNGTYTLPMGNLYGMIEKLNQLAKDEIGLPKATLSNTLNDNEIWLEGAEVSKLTYSKLYAIYGDDYGTPTDSANFVLPDFRNRVMQGIGSGGSFGYISAGLPNITGTFNNEMGRNPGYSGAFYGGGSVSNNSAVSDGETDSHIVFDASRSNGIYGKSSTVQPPAIKVRFKTRFQ